MAVQHSDKDMTPLWPYSFDDQTTWPWLDCVVEFIDGKMQVTHWIKNQSFKYGHLIKGY